MADRCGDLVRPLTARSFFLTTNLTTITLPKINAFGVVVVFCAPIWLFFGIGFSQYLHTNKEC